MYWLRYCCALILLLTSLSAHAFLAPLLDKGEWSGETGFELRYFDKPGEFGQAQWATSLRLQSEYHVNWNDGADFFTLTPYVRLDQEDDERTHGDLREALWIHVGDSWELRSGITRVFWGRTEFIHLVDVINQLDLVDGEDEKLGQPMVNLSLVHDWGIFDFYFLMGFRERTFAGQDGRLRTPLVVDTDAARYLGSASRQSMDFAFRWQRPLSDELEMALSLFSGVDREPAFSFNFDFFNPMLVPNYSMKTQIGLELEYIHENWAIKFEGIDVTNVVNDYHAAVLGVEYSFYSILDSNIDLTLISEYMWDSRDERALGFREHDAGVGVRLTFNDEFDTLLEGGVLWDPHTNEKAASLEAERRLSGNLKLKLLARVLMERGQPRLDDNLADIVVALMDSPLFNEALVNRSQLTAYIADLVREQSLDLLANSQQFMPALQQLQRLADSNRKLSLLERDDYIQLELVYYY